MKKLIVIADWADDSLNRQEVRTAVEGFLQDPSLPNISFVSSTPSTIHTAFLLNQVVAIEERYGRPLDTVIFVNTDPRIQTTTGVAEAKGAELIVIKLKSGIYLCGPNAGYCFSMLHNQIDAVFTYPGLDKGTQFRSRDLYTRVCAHLMESLEDELDLEETNTDYIPELTGYYIAHIDNHGNMKTTITHEDIKSKFHFGDTISIEINKITKQVQYVDNLFGGKPGELVIYPGSSGTKENPYLEISIWRHFTEEDKTTGMHAFHNPLPGTPIRIIS